jgi:signal transduction histidine kinase/CHASE1-domain containing sensor protein/CheY-like chemotaxis protein
MPNRTQGWQSHRSRKRRVFLPYLILLLGLCFTILVYYYFSKLTREQDQSRFNQSVQEIQDKITLRVQTAVALLRAGTGLFAASTSVERSEFDRFVQQIELQKNYPGIHGIGFSRRFSAKELPDVEATMRKSGFPDFRVWPDYPRDEYHAIVYLQPQNQRNRLAMGYDMFTEPVRREAMERARDKGIPSASGRVVLIQERTELTNAQAGFLIYAPVYREDATITSEADLRNALVGFVYSPFRADDFLEPVTREKHYDVRFTVYDGTAETTESLIHESPDADPSYESRFKTSRAENVAGRTWTIAYATKPSFEAASNQPFVKYTLVVGAFLSLLFFAVSRGQVMARMSAERAAADLKESESTVRKTLVEREKAEIAVREADQRALLEYERLLARISLLAQALGTAQELNAIFRALREFTDVSVPCDGFFVSLYDPVRDVRTACYGWGDGAEVDVSELPAMPVTAQGPNSRAVRTGEVVITDNYMQSQRGHPTVVVGPDNGLRPETSMAVPMAVMGRIIGTIEVQSYKPGVYRPEHVTAMSMAANLTAVAIENVRLLKLERTARQAAEESNRLKDEFLATVSHELRTPLTAILGWSRLLEDGSVDHGLSKQAIETICRNAKAQAQIVDDILDVSRIITGNLYLDMHPLEVAPIIKNAINVVRPTADAKGIKIETRLGATLALVSGDGNRLQQVIWNVLSNAVKFTNSGGRVTVRLSQVGSTVEIAVSDTGQGIRREFIPFVFDRFRQADSTTTRHHGGLGLGLAIARHLIEIHGGQITAESGGEGRGSTFTIKLPVIEPSLKPAAIFADAGDHGGAAVAPQLLSGVNVLLVDDDSDTLKLMTTALTRRQATVTAVSSANEAINAIRRRRPDVLVSDIAMPDEDGYGLIQKIRSLENGAEESIPAVAITAYAKEEDRAKALSSGYQIYLAKPVELTELISVVARAARRDF